MIKFLTINKQIKTRILASLFTFLLAFSFIPGGVANISEYAAAEITSSNIPTFSDSPYIEVNGNIPEFSNETKARTDAFETYSDLDSLGRCGVAFANICKEIMPTEKREDIGSVHPSGWQSGQNWERCHLIGFQLSGENANEKNLVTGSHYFNVTGMLPFENEIAEYVKETNHHVIYRVTPVFKKSELICRGVQMEAWSVEDSGKGVCFNVFCFNVSPGEVIDYTTGYVTDENADLIEGGTYKKEYTAAKLKKEGKSFAIGATAKGKLKYTKKSGSKYLSVSEKGKVKIKKGTPAGKYTMKVLIKASKTSTTKATKVTKTVTVTVTSSEKKKSTKKEKTASSDDSSSDATYILNTNTKKYHYPTCSSVRQMSDKNKEEYTGNKKDLESKGYSPCQRCNP